MVALPKENELVFAVVKKIMPYGAFCSLTEYGNLEGFMHVSEVAPRWIKNIREFLSENQKLVLKVHRVDREKNQVDLSLKRVSESERVGKLEAMRRETRAAKLLQVALKNAKSRKPFEKLRSEIEEKHGELFSFFESVRDEGGSAFEGLDIPDELGKEIEELVAKYVKKPVVEISRTFKITCYEPDGIEVIKKALEGVPAHYLGAGRYRMKVESEDPKAADKEMDRTAARVEKALKGKDCAFSVEENK
ncbi:MAG: S1 RNA-binding domain-containing protein [Candidatus Micrarchaeota archaeon]